ncbi:MAG: serine hydrolase, partial [Phenylobacterium sp.]
MHALATVLLAGLLAVAPVLPAAAQDTPPPIEAASPPPVASAPVPDPLPVPKPRPKAAIRPAAAGPLAAGPAAPTVSALPTLPSGARLAPGQAMAPAELEAFVDGVVSSAMAGDHVAGVAVSVVQNGQVVLKKGYGFADLASGRRVDPDQTLFRIGSISKTFTYIARM